MTHRFIPLDFERLGPEESRERVRELRDRLRRRRSVRDFSSDPVPLDLIDCAIEAAASAPSGANRQPWRFVVVQDPDSKRRIREGAEAEEKAFYERRATPEWLADLAPLGTDWRKPFLERAPVLVVVFAIDWETRPGPEGAEVRRKNYYVQESVGIAAGMLLAALHSAGLATLAHTPSPMGFLGRILDRPRNERPFLLIPVGYPAPDATVPDIRKKSLDDVRELR
ncbi:MAG: nitroreductase family protein [Acidobacteria bacterium]|jgi:nitroreductase|nr:nitroreductase family protein [Acidobacteriota bacterium]